MVISIRDTDRDPFIKKNVKQSLAGKLLAPLAGMASNWDNLQGFRNDNALEYTKKFMEKDELNLDLVSFQYIPEKDKLGQAKSRTIDFARLQEEAKNERAKLSWHLTNREKQSILETINVKENKSELKRLKKLLDNNKLISDN